MPHIKAIRRYINAGLSSAPVKIEVKYPSMLPSWKRFQSEKANENEIKQWQTSYRDANIYGCCLFCGAISGGLEVIDIDNHLDNADEIFDQLTNIDEVAEVVQYLPIEKTKNGGYHIFYKCEKSDGNLKLATQKKKTVIETRGEGGLIVCAPTNGYEVLQGSLTEIPTITPDQKELLFYYAKMFGDVDDVKEKEPHHAKEYDGLRPGDWYNENCIEEAKDLLKKHGWAQLTNGTKELWRRPGKNKGVSATFGFVAPHIFYPFSANSAPFEERKCYSPFYIFALLEFNNDFSAASREIIQRHNLKPEKKTHSTPSTLQNSATEPTTTTASLEPTTATAEPEPKKDNQFIKTKLESTSSDDRNFWYFGGKDGTKFCIDYFLLKVFLEKYGYFRYEINKDKYLFLKITNNIADAVSFETIRDFILNHLVRLQEHDIYNRFCDSSKFNEKTLSIVGSVEIEWMKDTKEDCYLFFQNGFTKTTESGTTLHNYSEMNGVIWKSQQLNRNYTIRSFDVKETYPYRFCSLVSANEETRVNAYMSALGYLAHGFKQESFCPAIIFCDENDTDEPWGGTGKGMSAKFIGHIRNLVSIDGKAFDSKERFAMQRVKEDTNVILIEDLDKHFKFENLFSKLTDGLTINRLYLGEIYIPFRQSPKWSITANYMIKGSNSSSFERRMFPIEIHRFFTPEHTPDQEFDKSFFHDWDEMDWNKFDFFMHECVKLWLSKGLIKPNYVTINRNKLKVNTSSAFVEWADNNIKTDSRYLKTEFFAKFKNDLNDPWIFKHLSQNMFSRWIAMYCDFAKLDSDMQFGSGGQWILIGKNTDEELFEQTEDAPF